MSDVAQIAPPPTAAADRPRICAVCTSRTQGFGWFDPRVPRAQRQHRWFCSMPCQGLFAHKARNRRSAQAKGLMMPDFTEEETEVLPAVMRALAPVMERIGWDRPLASLTANDMHRLIVTTVAAFRAEMRAIASDAEVPF